MEVCDQGAASDISGPFEGAACIDGSYVACESLVGMDQYCGVCGCDGPGQVCRNDPEGATPSFCGPPAQIGEPCLFDEECISYECLYCPRESCAFLAGTCGVPMGSECTVENCEVCIDTGVSTFCTRDCTEWSIACYSPLADFVCASRGFESFRRCWLACTPGTTVCPAGLTCTPVNDQWGNPVDYACM